MILDIKEEHLEEWSKLYNENLDEYIILHKSTMKKIGVGRVVSATSGQTDYITTTGDIFDIVTYISTLATNQIKEKYREQYTI